MLNKINILENLLGKETVEDTASSFAVVKKLNSLVSDGINHLLHLGGQQNDSVASAMEKANEKSSSGGVSNATLSDLTKLSYKEMYAYYKYIDRDQNIKGNWDKLASVDQIRSGLNARVFINDQLKEINIAFEGSHGFTKLLGENIVDSALFKDLYQCSAGFTKFISPTDYDRLYDKWHLLLGKDGLADLQLMSNKVPDQYYAAYAWFKDTMNDIKNNSDLAGYQVVITGHSLAGGLAQMVAGNYYLETNEKVPTMAIQGPGMLTQLEQVVGHSLDAKEFSFIVNFCMEGDPVGDFMKENHIGITVPLPYDLARGDRPGDLPNYRVGMEIYQAITGIKNIRLDRHEIGQQIHIFDGTNFSYPENRVILSDTETSYKSLTNLEELIAGNDLGNEIHGNDQMSYIVGGKGNDTIYGGIADDFLAGGDGDDIIYGGKGNNILYGGAGNDYLEGGAGNDELYGGLGNDTLIWSGGKDFLYGQGGENQYILGKAQDGHLTSGTVTLKFDRENIENSHVLFQLADLDVKNSQIVFLMSDQILPSHILMTEKDQSLYIQYGDHSSIQIDQWSSIKDSLGSNITFQFLGSESMQYGVSGSTLVRK